MGINLPSLDDTLFRAAADTLYDEGFGFVIPVDQTETIENFIQVVLDHIGGILYVTPDTAKFALN